jgi:hypothetical protein
LIKFSYLYDFGGEGNFSSLKNGICWEGKEGRDWTDGEEELLAD